MFKNIVDCGVDRDEARELLRYQVHAKNEEYKDLTEKVFSATSNDICFARTAETKYKQSSFTEGFTSVTTADDGTRGVPEIRAACTQYAATLIIERLKGCTFSWLQNN